MKDLAIKYFEHWNNHDLDGLRSILSANVSLVDWELNVSGIENVLVANRKTFESLPNISLDVIDLGVSANKVMAEIIVDLGNGTTIDVVDVLTIIDKKIVSIKAFKI